MVSDNVSIKMMEERTITISSMEIIYTHGKDWEKLELLI
jgi:hypothetical protein